MQTRSKTVSLKKKEEKQRQTSAEELLIRLRNDGHKCMKTYETYPIQIRWCGQKVCKNNVLRRIWV